VTEAALKPTFARTTLIVVTAVLGACAGGLENYDAQPIAPQFEVDKTASAECVQAAKRASRWCIGRKSMFDLDGASYCNDARWDYRRYCN
jgi:hypothetical protein